MLLGALLVLALSAGAGAVLASGEVNALRHDFDINPPLAIAARDARAAQLRLGRRRCCWSATTSVR